MMQEANDVAWEDLAVGQTAEFTWTVTEDILSEANTFTTGATIPVTGGDAF